MDVIGILNVTNLNRQELEYLYDTYINIRTPSIYELKYLKKIINGKKQKYLIIGNQDY